MSRNFLRFFFRAALIIKFVNQTKLEKFQKLKFDEDKKFSHLLDFTCATAKDELEKHPEMRTIAMIELENNFPSEFSAKVLKCLPLDVAKIIINPHSKATNNVTLPKQSMVIYVTASKVEWNETFFDKFSYFERNSPTVSHLSKHLIVSREKSEEMQEILEKLANAVQIYEEDQKVFARNFRATQNLTNLDENLSEILYADKTKELSGKALNAFFTNDMLAYGADRNYVNCKWTPFLELISRKLNLQVNFSYLKISGSTWDEYFKDQELKLIELMRQGKLDFFFNFANTKSELHSYTTMDWCFMAPFPKPYSIAYQILFLPMDKSCWMWLGITIAVSTLIWRISEFHWNFPFGFFAYFMGQGQLIIRIKANRLTMKILLQLLIFAIFIFSNGYQSLVTSFMLDPMQVKLFKTTDELVASDLNVDTDFYGKVGKDLPKFQNFSRDGRVKELKVLRNSFKDVIDLHLAYLQPCEITKQHLKDFRDGIKLYLIPEVIVSLRSDLYIRPFHPLLDKLQELMDRSFDAGLHQAWEQYYWIIFRQASRIIWTLNPEEDDILDFKEIIPFFLILAIGFGSAFLTLLFEIFYRDFISQLSMEYCKRKMRIRQRRITVRRIEVKPQCQTHVPALPKKRPKKFKMVQKRTRKNKKGLKRPKKIVCKKIWVKPVV